MKSIKEVTNFEGKRVLVRTDWNVPILDGRVLDTTRIDVSLPTIEYILENNGLPTVISHLGRVGESLQPVIDIFHKRFPKVSVLENLRQEPDEELNGQKFAKKLAGLADIYVNDAFSASHREHASIVGIPKYLPSYAGLRFMEEVEKLSEAFNPEHPFLFILGGAKFKTKLPLVEKFLEIADDIFIGGALARQASLLPIAKNPKVIFPVGDMAALDINEQTLEILKLKIENSKFILWNGPLGKYEESYKEGTLKLASMLGNSKAKVIAGGGDTENVIDELGVAKKFYFISLAGGAMLEFLSKGTLPGIEALNQYV